MAQYHHLSIYKKSFDLLVKVTQLTSNFSRDFRYTIGEKLNNGCMEFIVLIYKANTERLEGRKNHILRLLEMLQVTNILVRLSCELKNISKEKYTEVISMTEDIERQLNGWLNYTDTEIENERNTKKGKEEGSLSFAG